MNGRSVQVQTAGGNYRVVAGENLLPGISGFVVDALGYSPTRVFVVSDSGLPRVIVDLVRQSLEAGGARVSNHVVRPTERDKSLETLENILIAIAQSRHERTDAVLALGGGIVGDTAGFAAASYRRGVPVIQCPTTLLAMVDASVGGKTGVNLADPAEQDGLRKNFVGAFHQPGIVVADVGVLDSLSDRHLRCGLAECIKHGMIGAEAGDSDLTAWTADNLAGVLGRDRKTLIELVARNVAVKAAIVGRDTQEMQADGGRALLNIGHTFAHAIEPVHGLSPDADPGNAPLQHGEAVSLGLVAAAHSAKTMELCDPSVGESVEALLSAAGLPTRVAGLPDTESILQAMFHDKKVTGDQLRLVLPTEMGRASVVTDPPLDAVRAAIDSIRT